MTPSATESGMAVRAAIASPPGRAPSATFWRRAEATSTVIRRGAIHWSGRSKAARLSVVPVSGTTILTATDASSTPTVPTVSATPVAFLADEPGAVEGRSVGGAADRRTDGLGPAKERAPARIHGGSERGAHLLFERDALAPGPGPERGGHLIVELPDLEIGHDQR